MKMIQKAYKTRLETNDKLFGLFKQYSGTTRYVYNWGLAEWQRQYETWCAGELDKKPSAYRLRKQFNALKSELCPWIKLYPYCLIEWAFINLGTAYQNFHRRVKAGVSGKEVGHPKFKRRGGHDSFGIRGYRTDKGRIWLGSRIGWVRFSEQDYIPPDIQYREGGATYVVISREADHWFVSVSVEQEIVQPPLNDLVLGIDLGISHLAVLSNGRVFENPKPLGQALRKLQRLDKELSRRKRGSQNWKKTKRKLARAHYKVKCIRLDAQHQISYYVTYMVKPAVIVLEDLNVAGMLQNRRLARAISDVGFGELRRQIEYKAEGLGIKVINADRWYPSSKTCSRCGTKRADLTLDKRAFICPICDLNIDRDFNAALNLQVWGIATFNDMDLQQARAMIWAQREL